MKRITSYIVIIISIINILFTIIGYILSINPNTSMSEPVNITIFAIVVLLLQIINIVVAIRLIKEKVKKEKLSTAIVVIMIIATIFIPVKAKSWIKYTFPKNNDTQNEKYNSDKIVNGVTSKNKKFNPENFGSTKHTIEYKNVYGITIKTNNYISAGIEIY